ncbi:serine hydrolase domain-containing protein [Streptomyces sp. NPDC050610]|uniref:serine hydrolase domain-containing protein n=1 Tax=Streptomyces sp. NPDC050610 TaxID=3157097 RepID=UPI003428C2D5
MSAALTVAALAAPAQAETGRGHGHTATQQAMDAQVAAGAPGSLGQARDGNGTWNGSAGVADLRTERPRKAADRFRVGSVTKAFVSTVLLQLESEGKLSLDDTVEHWLPGAVQGHGNDGSKIKIRQLLNHTSGLFNYTEDPVILHNLSDGFFEHRYDTYTPERLVRVAVSHKPEFEPGTSWKYSNTNYILAGMIVDKAAGHSYADEIERRIIEPLGLHSTTLPGTSARMPSPHGRAYSPLTAEPNAKIHDVTELNPSWGGAAGEIISTTGDLNRFYRALLGGDLLPAAQQKELLTTVAVDPANTVFRYGLGVAWAKLPCGKEIWMHDGGIHGSLSLATSTPDGRHTAAFNLNGDWAGEWGPVMEAEYCGKAPATGARSPLDKALTALR